MFHFFTGGFERLRPHDDKELFCRRVSTFFSRYVSTIHLERQDVSDLFQVKKKLVTVHILQTSFESALLKNNTTLKILLGDFLPRLIWKDLLFNCYVMRFLLTILGFFFIVMHSLKKPNVFVIHFRLFTFWRWSRVHSCKSSPSFTGLRTSFPASTRAPSSTKVPFWPSFFIAIVS